MNNMSHQHDVSVAVWKDEESESSVSVKELPKPLNWKILIQPNQVNMKTKGGLYLASISKDNEEYLTAHGRIAAMGDLAYKDRDTGEAWKTMSPKVNDRVTYGKYAGQKIVINGVKFLLLNDDELTSIIPESAKISAYLA
jgi:co-chaperonin GroES (HSP10)|tara:strand:+ start:201 stop:620 length:420 start_codon:yes stop_codon:yes gene_type:complete